MSCLRFDPLRSFLVNYLIRGVAWIPLLGIPIFLTLFYSTLPPDLPAELKIKFYLLVLGALIPGLLVSLSFLWLSGYLRRLFYESYIRLDNVGLFCRRGIREAIIPWAEVRDLSLLEMGRMQSATIYGQHGKIQFDAYMVDSQKPIPKSKIRMGGEFLVYPDGQERPLKIRQNELVQMIQSKIRQMQTGG